MLHLEDARVSTPASTKRGRVTDDAIEASPTFSTTIDQELGVHCLVLAAFVMHAIVCCVDSCPIEIGTTDVDLNGLCRLAD